MTTDAAAPQSPDRAPAIPRLLRVICPNLFAAPFGQDRWGNLNGALVGSLAAIPQTMAYGLLIGGAMGSEFGGVGVFVALYGSVVVGLMAALFGGCPFLVAGPRASTLLVFAALIAHLTQTLVVTQIPNPVMTALTLACAAAVVSGLLQLIYSLLRLGRLASYVPLPVVAGFVNGSALLILLSQVWSATGVPPQQSIWSIFTLIDQIKPANLTLALATTAAVLFLPRLTKRIPVVLVTFVIGTAIYHVLAAWGLGDALGGTLPPPPEHFAWSFIGRETFEMLSGPLRGELMRPMLLAAVSMSILSTLDTLLSTAAVDGITHRSTNADRQLMAEGGGNVIAGLFCMAPGSGSMARTQAAFKGGMTGAGAPLGIAIISLVIALALGPAISLLSQAVMAGILIALGIELIDKWTLTRVRRALLRGSGPSAARTDLVVVAVVVVTTVLVDLTMAVGVGVVMSLLSFVMQMARSPIRRSYRADWLISRVYGDIVRRRFLEQYGQRIAIIELEGALFFGTVSELNSSVNTLINDGIAYVVLDMRRVKHIDVTGARTLERLSTRLTALGGLLAISHVERERRLGRDQPVGADNRRQSSSRGNWIKLADLGTIKALGEEHFLGDTDSAIALCERHLATSLPNTEDASEILASMSPLMRSLDRPMRRRLRDYLSRMSYAADETVFLQNSDPDGAYFVVCGRLDVLINVPGTERKRKMQTLMAGSVFGEMALLDARLRSAGIVAVEQTTCYWMSSKNFARLKQEQNDIALALLSDVAMIFAERLRATTSMLAEMDA